MIMFAKEYYYFVTGLPNIGFEDSKVAYNPSSFLNEAREKLSKSDNRLLELLVLQRDIDNLLSMLFGKTAQPEGLCIIDADSWQSLIEYLKPNPDKDLRHKPQICKRIPEFIITLTKEFLSREDEQSFLEWETLYLQSFYRLVLSHNNRFINAWFQYNRDMQNILIAMGGRKHSYPYAGYLLGEGDDVEKLSKSQAPDFGLGKQHYLFEALSRVYEQYSVIDRERNYDALRWRWIDNQNFFQYFNIDRILGYFCKLCILDRWINLDPDHGKEVFFDTLNELENSFVFPEEFDLKQKVK